ncbi:MAG: dihydroorotase [Planctomycetes bacterium]|nr:dihydroorotase [Planctomycetota bacterium]
MADILIKNGRVICPDQGLDEVADLLITDGRIATIGAVREPAHEVIDAAGKIVCPGLIDMHVHLREPGDCDEETIATGSAAAIAGGFTTIVAMPNTDPPIDNPAAAEYVINKGRQANLANVLPAGAITLGREGTELTEMGLISLAGAAAFTDDGSWVTSAGLMAKALKYAKLTGLPIMSHCEDPSLAGNGVMNAGRAAAELGLAGTPVSAEETAIARDIILAHETGGRLHVTHVSTAGGVELIRRAKERGDNITADATPHHLTLTEEFARGYNTNARVNPPLRTKADVDALRAGIKDGTIDAIASDHAPHAPQEKACEFDKAAPGVVGLETTLSMLAAKLVGTDFLTWPELIAALTIRPARALGIAKGTLRPGADADIVVIDPAAEWIIDSARFVSRGRNCPFDGMSVVGRAEVVIAGGAIKDV